MTGTTLHQHEQQAGSRNPPFFSTDVRILLDLLKQMFYNAG